ncbi:gluconokinase [Comamonadaceae bacterium PP-2]
MTQKIVIGVDIGTTSTKAIAIDVKGRVLAHHAVDYPLLRPEPAAAEQDPQQIFEAVTTVIQSCAAQCRAKQADTQVLAVSFSAAMHSLIAIDGDDQPLTHSITWADNRAAPWAERIGTEWDGLAIYRRTGTPIHPMSPLAKLVWLRHEKPELFARTRRFVGIKEFVFHRLFGQWVVDHSIASATGLFNLERLDWDEGALAMAGIEADQLATPRPTTDSLRSLPASLAESLGLPADTPFVLGANDGVLSNLGVNAIQRGEVAVTIGTSGAMRCVVDRPLTDAEGRTFCYALTQDHWVVGGPVNNGGIILRWVRDEFAAAETETAKRLGIDPYEVLTRIAERVSPGAEGLLFHPFLAGERAPYWDARLRGSFFGLGMHHGKEHMIRAALEGVIFNLYSILPAVEAVAGTSRAIKATGGFARSPMWRQMMADVFNRDVIVPESFESSCLGAAVLALYALGHVESLDVVADMVGATHRHSPDPESAALYDQLKPVFLSLPHKLQDEYRTLAAFQQRVGSRALNSSQ